MNENLGEIIFNIMVEGYKDKVDINKDLIDYLKDNTKHELLSVYLSYGYAGNMDDIVEQIVSLQNQKKQATITQIMSFLDNGILSILKFLNKKRINDAKLIANTNGLFKFSKNDGNNVSLDTIKILKQLNFIFCKKDKDEIIVHMPKYIKERINSIIGNLYSDYYDEIISYTKGIADTYGVIHIEDAYDIIKNDVLIDFEKYDSIIKFVSILELNPIYYSFARQCICNFNLRDEEIDNILSKEREFIIYNRDIYKSIGNDEYLYSLKEYKEFRNFLKAYYHFDINEDELLRGEIINDYIDMCQIEEKEAKDRIQESLNRYFDIDNLEKQEIIEYVDKIRKRIPNWKNGGKIDNEIKFPKVGRNEPCPCGSGKKYKNCHRKIRRDIIIKEEIKELALLLAYLTSLDKKDRLLKQEFKKSWKGYNFEILNNLNEEEYMKQKD